MPRFSVCSSAAILLASLAALGCARPDPSASVASRELVLEVQRAHHRGQLADVEFDAEVSEVSGRVVLDAEDSTEFTLESRQGSVAAWTWFQVRGLDLSAVAPGSWTLRPEADDAVSASASVALCASYGEVACEEHLVEARELRLTLTQRAEGVRVLEFRAVMGEGVDTTEVRGRVEFLASAEAPDA